MLRKLKRSYCEGLDVMSLVREASDSIMREHGPGHTECVYEKLLSHWFYERCVPFMTQVDCFIQKDEAQVLRLRLLARSALAMNISLLTISASL
jgi:hypothetical protein